FNNLNGNIVNLIRTTADLGNNAIDMDNLTYTYQNGNNNSNRLMRVEDGTSVFSSTAGITLTKFQLLLFNCCHFTTSSPYHFPQYLGKAKLELTDCATQPFHHSST